MRVKVQELQEGCILSEDVFSRTSRPIIPQKTILTKELIDFLHAFLIREVRVEKRLVNGMIFVPSEILEDEKNESAKEKDTKDETFTELFLKSVNEYKKEFNSWQSGLPVNISRVRAIILPLIEKSEASSSELFFLHHFSTENEYIFQHSIAVGLICGFIGKKLNYQRGDVVQLVLAGCLSDCGMAKIPAHVINKKAVLTSGEFEEVKNHPQYSYKMIQNSSLIREAGKIAIFQHHERLDGSGYPLGKKDQEIHPFAKIIAVADTFHAMTSARLYRKKQSPFKVLEMIKQDNFGKFDIAAINALQSGFMNFSIGSRVKLSNGQNAEILFIKDQAPTRPLVRLLDSDEILALEKNRDIFIQEIL